jgi:hypothetical protein
MLFFRFVVNPSKSGEWTLCHVIDERGNITSNNQPHKSYRRYKPEKWFKTDPRLPGSGSGS